MSIMKLENQQLRFPSVFFLINVGILCACKYEVSWAEVIPAPGPLHSQESI